MGIGHLHRILAQHSDLPRKIAMHFAHGQCKEVTGPSGWPCRWWHGRDRRSRGNPQLQAFVAAGHVEWLAEVGAGEECQWHDGRSGRRAVPVGVAAPVRAGRGGSQARKAWCWCTGVAVPVGALVPAGGTGP